MSSHVLQDSPVASAGDNDSFASKRATPAPAALRVADARNIGLATVFILSSVGLFESVLPLKVVPIRLGATQISAVAIQLARCQPLRSRVAYREESEGRC